MISSLSTLFWKILFLDDIIKERCQQFESMEEESIFKSNVSLQ